MPDLASQERALSDADVVQCVGHSLGGAIATLIAALYAGKRGAGDQLPLTTALSAADLERWIVLYEAEHEGLQRAVEETRKPEPVL